MDCLLPGDKVKDKKGKAAWNLLGGSNVKNIPERGVAATVWPPPRLLPETYEYNNGLGVDAPFRVHDTSPIYIDGSGM